MYISHEKARLLHIVQQLEYGNRQHELLSRFNDGLTRTIVGIQQALNAEHPDLLLDPVGADLAVISSALPSLQEAFPGALTSLSAFQRQMTRFQEAPAISALEGTRDSAQELAAQVARLEGQIQQRDARLELQYVDLNHRITVTLLLINGLGLACFGAAVIVFFSKLASDISKLERRAMAVVGGNGLAPRNLSRRDELGGLMQAFNRMQETLQRREQAEEISRQQLFHREKMAAIGSVAAALAHEIGNPINAISGIAQHTVDEIRSGRPLDRATLLAGAESTIRQSERVGSIVRQLADLGAPPRPDPELLNLNELAQTTCSFIRYDKRFCSADLVQDLDRNLPAVRAVADHLTQVLMNLLINAADALEGLLGAKPTIRVSTRHVDGEIELCVHDNGHGMGPGVLSRAFEQSFTTKPAGKGRGIGLYLSRALIEDLGGRIELDSTPGLGTAARVRLPSANIGSAA